MIRKIVRTAIAREAVRISGVPKTVHGYGLVLKAFLKEASRSMLNDTLEDDYDTIKPKPVVKAVKEAEPAKVDRKEPITKKIIKKSTVKKGNK